MTNAELYVHMWRLICLHQNYDTIDMVTVALSLFTMDKLHKIQQL